MAERTDFLYPFIEGDERDASALLIDLGESAVAKAEASVGLRTASLEANAERLVAAADALVASFAAGGRLFTFGNGGSSTDAASLASLFTRPPWGVALPARCLVEDTAIVTALANDIGFDLVFARQLIAHGRAGDVALGLSTSGNSRNLLVGFAEARRRGITTLGLAGYDGGEMATSADVEHCFVVHSESVHRIQEAQAALGFALWEAVQERCGGRDG